MSIFVFGEDLSAEGDLEQGQIIERTILMSGKEYRGQGDDFIEVTPAMLNQAVNNFEDKAAGDADLAVNFSHDRGGAAGAWIKDLSVSDDSRKLVAKLKITGKGATELNEGNYRYPSIEMFKDGFQRNDGKKFNGCVIVGCAFLNNPQQKGIDPVVKFDAETALAELDALSSMELMSVVERTLELMSDLSDEEQGRLDQILSTINGEKVEVTEETKMRDKANSKVIKLQDQIDTLQKQNDVATKKELFSDMLSTGHITPAQQESFMALDVAQAEAFKSVRVAGKPELDFSEIGSSHNPGEKNKDQIEFDDEVNDLVMMNVDRDIAIKQVKKSRGAL